MDEAPRKAQVADGKVLDGSRRLDAVVRVGRHRAGRSSRDRYRLLFQLATEAVLILDASSGKLEEANPAAGNGAFHPRIPRFRRSMTDYERLGLTGALQWKPNADTDVNLDLMYGKFDNIRYDKFS